MAADKCRGVSPLIVEAMAMRLACVEALRLGLHSIHLEGDCLTVINAVLLAGNCPWEIDLLVSDIRHSLSGLHEVTIKHIFREANSLADKTAALRHLIPSSAIVHHNEFCSIVRKDAIGCWVRRV